MTAAPLRTLETLLAITAGGEGKHGGIQVKKAAIDLRGVILRRNGAAVTGVSDENLPLAVDFRADGFSEILHRQCSRGEPRDVNVRGSKIGFASCDESVSGKVNQHAILRSGNGGKPLLEFMPQVLQRGLIVRELVHVFSGEVAAVRADERGVHILGIAIGKLKLRFCRQMLVVRDANHQSIAVRNDRGCRSGGLGRRFFDMREVAILLVRLRRRSLRHADGAEAKGE